MPTELSGNGEVLSAKWVCDVRMGRDSVKDLYMLVSVVPGTVRVTR